MSAAALLLSLVCSAAVVSSLAVLAVVGRRSVLPEWHGSAAWAGGIAIALCAAVALGQALGAVGLLHRWPIVAASAVAAGAALGAGRRWGPPTTAPRPGPGPEPGPGPGLGAVAVAVVTFAVLVVGALWVARTAIVLREGIVDPDTLGYHLPLTQAFARDGHADSNLVRIPEFGVYTYPANDELLGAMALAISRSVVFTALKNLVFAAGALVAGHAIGSRVRAGPAATVAVAAILGTPVIAFTVAGTGKNDAIALLAVLLGLACLILSGGRTAPLALAAACGGIAVGTKLSSVVAGGAIVVWAVVVARRWGAPLLVALAALVTGAPWYLRNLISYRNPVPLVGVSAGPISLPSISLESARRSTSVAHFLFRGRYLATLLNGLKDGVGPLGLLVVLGCLAGLVVGFLAGGWRRVLASVGAVLILGYLTTPAGAYTGPGGRPIRYAIALNVHYALPAAAVCLLALAVSLPPRYTSWGIAVVCVAVTLVGLHVGIALSYWATHLGGAGFVVLLLAVAVGAGAAGLRQAGRAGWRPAVAAALAVAVAGVAFVAASRPSQRGEDPVVRYLAAAPPLRIVTDSAYPGSLYGPGGRDQVIFQTGVVNGVLSRFMTCRSWMASVAARGASAVAVANAGQTHDWVAADPAFALAASDPRVQVYLVNGVPGARCGASG